MMSRIYAGITALVALSSMAVILLAVTVGLRASVRLPPHIVCWRTSPSIVYLHLIGDLLIWSAYVVVPMMLVYLLVAGRLYHQQQLFYPLLVVWGALFIWFCGNTHLLDAIEIWWPVQWQRGIVKVATGIVSWVFVCMLTRRRRAIVRIARAVSRAFDEEETYQ